MNKICLNCETPITIEKGKRNDRKFCSNTCKDSYWNLKKKQDYKSMKVSTLGNITEEGKETIAQPHLHVYEELEQYKTRVADLESQNSSLYFEKEVLNLRLEQALEKTERLDSRNKELEKKNDELYHENTSLMRENLYKKDKLELEYKRKEYELLKSQKQGLGGIMDNLGSMPPEMWKLLAGFFPNLPMAKISAQAQQNNQQNKVS